MKQAIENGKHILVEKSITLNSDELNEMAKLADKNHVIIGEFTVYKRLLITHNWKYKISYTSV